MGRKPKMIFENKLKVGFVPGSVWSLNQQIELAPCRLAESLVELCWIIPCLSRANTDERSTIDSV